MKSKKILCAVMCIGLFTFVSCGSNEVSTVSKVENSQVATVKLVYDDDFIGEWNSVAVKMNTGEELTIDKVAKSSEGTAEDYFCKLIVNSDKTGTLEDSSDTFEGNWSCSSNKLTFTSDGQNGWNFTYEDDGRITLPLENGNKLILAK